MYVSYQSCKALFETLIFLDLLKSLLLILLLLILLISYVCPV
jgi:hypothetical protein